MLADEELVFQHPGASGGAARSSTSVSQSVVAARGEHTAPKSFRPEPSRLEVIREGIGKDGFSARAAEFIAQARRPSTTACYDAKWKVWVSWCAQRQVNPVQPAIGQVGEFFRYLFEERQAAVSTIKGYRSALASCFKFNARSAVNIGSRPQAFSMIFVLC